MRRLNLKFLAGLTVSGVVLGAGTVGLHELQSGRSASLLLKRAKAAEEKGDLAEARTHLERYLGFKPGDNGALARYGQLLDETAKTPGQRLRALLTLEQALRREPDLHKIRRRIVNLDLDLGRPADAKRHLEVLREHKPDNAELEHLTARAVAAERTYAEAVPWYEKAVGHDPARIEAFEELAGLYRDRLNKAELADAVMDRLVKKNGQSARAYLARWRYRTAHGLDGADEDAAKARTLQPDDPDVLLAVASEAQKRNQVEEARETLARGESKAPGEARLYQARAALERQAGNVDEAIQALSRGIRAVGDEESGLMLRWDLVNLLTDAGLHDEAANALAEIKRDTLAPALRNYLQARLPMADHHWALAQKELEKARPALADVPAWANHVARLDLDLAVCAERLGNPDRRISALRRVAEASGDSPGVHRLLAETLADSGQTDRAIEQYERAVLRDADAWPSLARLLLVRTLREPPEMRDWTALEQALDRAERARPGTIELAILRAEMLLAREQADKALALLEATRQAHPDQVGPWVGLVLLNQRLGHREDAGRLLDEARTRLGQRVELALAGLALAMTGPDPARQRQEVDALEAKLSDFSPADRRSLGGALANARTRLGQDDQAERLWQRLSEENPDDLEIRLVRLDRALLEGDASKIGQVLGEVRRIEGQGGDLAALGEARWLVLKARKGDTRALTQALDILERLARSRPDWPPLVLAKAEADDLAGDRDKALEGYMHAFDLGLRGVPACQRAAELLASAGRFDEADRMVRLLEEQGPLSGDLRRLSDGLALMRHDEQHALESARKAVEEGSKDPRDYLWLARVLWATDHKGEVEPVLRQALALDPKGPGARLALVEYLAAVGQKDEAVAILGEAADVLEETAPMALAVGFERVGDGARALKLADKALASKPEDPAALRDVAALHLRLDHADSAEPLLRRLMAMGAKDPSGSAWARQTLASLKAREGDYQSCEEALALLGPVSPDSPLEVRRLRAQILAAQPSRPHRDEAVRLLEGVVRQSSGAGALPETFLLARLLDEAGNWLGAQQYLLQVIEADPKNTSALAYYARALLKRDELGRARPYIDRLKQADPEGLVSAELEARALSAEGHGAEAASRIEAAVRDRGAAVEVQGAALMEELGLMDASEAMLRRLSEMPDGPGPLALARFLGRRGRLDEALGVCDRVRAGSDPVEFAMTCEALTQSPDASDAQRRKVSLWLQEAIRQHPDKPGLLTRLGVLQGVQGLYDESEQSYRRALAADPGDTVALNNLAWLLALRGGADRAREALSLVERAIQRIGPHPELLDTQTIAYLAAQQGDLAVESIGQAVKRAPSPPFYFHQTRAYQAVHDSRAAADAFRKATAAGLKADDLHPLERPVYLRLAIDLAGG